MRDPYDVLGVSRDADQEAIRKAYKQLARKYHPDRNKSPDAETRFKEINAANDILGDEAKRKLFDEFGEMSTRPGFDADKARAWSRASAGGGRAGGFPGGMGGGPGGYDFGGDVDIEDLLGSMFGAAAGGRGRPRARRGQDQQATMAIDPMLAILGGETIIQLPRPGGEAESLKVRIPAGVADGGKLRLKGQGYPPPGGGECGDLHIRLHVPAHPRLARDGDDLELEVPVTVLEALRGASIAVPTPTGEIKVNVPPGSSSGTKLRIRGRGVQRSGNPGDLYLALKVVVPDTSEEDAIAAAETLEKAYPGPVRAGLVL